MAQVFSVLQFFLVLTKLVMIFKYLQQGMLNRW